MGNAANLCACVLYPRYRGVLSIGQMELKRVPGSSFLAFIFSFDSVSMYCDLLCLFTGLIAICCLYCCWLCCLWVNCLVDIGMCGEYGIVGCLLFVLRVLLRS